MEPTYMLAMAYFGPGEGETRQDENGDTDLRWTHSISGIAF